MIDIEVSHTSTDTEDGRFHSCDDNIDVIEHGDVKDISVVEIICAGNLKALTFAHGRLPVKGAACHL